MTCLEWYNRIIASAINFLLISDGSAVLNLLGHCMHKSACKLEYNLEYSSDIIKLRETPVSVRY